MNKQLLENTRNEKGQYVLTVRVSPDDFAVALEAAYQLCKPQLELDGIPKGQVSRE